jgi:hypothetical protein
VDEGLHSPTTHIVVAHKNLFLCLSHNLNHGTRWRKGVSFMLQVSLQSRKELLVTNGQDDDDE